MTVRERGPRLARLVAMLFAFAAAGALAEERVALVIGNGRYAEKQFPKLAQAPEDARRIGDRLETLGFKVVRANDLTLPELERSVRAFRTLLAQEDTQVALLYYAGHGLLVDGINYLVPLGTRLESMREIESKTVSVDRILKEIGGWASPGRAMILVVDACRTGLPLPTTGEPVALGSRFDDSVFGNPNVVRYYAAARGGRAPDNGLFARLLDAQLGIPGQDLHEVFRHVKEGLDKETRGAQTVTTGDALPPNVVLCDDRYCAPMRSPPGGAPQAAGAAIAADECVGPNVPVVCLLRSR